MKRLTVNLSLFLVMALLLPIKAWAGSIVVIVNKGNPAASIDETYLADFFMKKKKFWPAGDSAVPIDQNDGLASRELFLRQILKKSSREMAAYWIERKQISGDSAPQKVASDELVIHFVKSLPWAIGYISSESLEGASGVKVIKTISD